LASAGHTEFLSQDVAVCLGSAWGDSQPLAYFVVVATGRNQLDHLPLAVGDDEGRNCGHDARLEAAFLVSY
jgi:hypothetical protein